MTSALSTLFVILSTLLWALAFATRSWFSAALALVFSVAAIAYIAVSARRPVARVGPPSPVSPPSPAPAPTRPQEPKTRRLVQPKTLDPRAVARAFFDNAFAVSQPVAAHIWLEDTETGTLRLVAGAGPLAPTNQPLPADQDTLGRSLAGGTAVLEPHARLSSADTEDTLWRYAVPIGYDSLRGVAALDFAAASPPDSAALNDIVAGFRPTLSGAIALYVADIRGEAARALLDAARALSRNLDPEQVVETALQTAMTSTKAATGSVMLLDEGEAHLRIVAAKGLPEDVVDSTEVAVGEGIAGWVAASNQPLLVEDLPGKTGRTDRHGVRSAVSVPIADEDGLLGVLNVGSRDFPARFTRAHLDILETLGRLTAVTLRNARAMSSAGNLYFDTLKALALALETKDPYAQGGTERVLHYSLLIGQAMGLSSDESRALEIAAMLHDIGMTGLDGTASTRPLSTVERGMLTMHPVIAADILEQAPALAAVVPIVYHHHEHYDGRGYVTGSSGDQIPLASRILAVADAYVAMTSDRPYRAAKSTERAMFELSDKAGTQFDPDVVQTFLHLLGSDSNRVPDHQP